MRKYASDKIGTPVRSYHPVMANLGTEDLGILSVSWHACVEFAHDLSERTMEGV